MLNRRILRIKAFKIIYAYSVTKNGTLEDALATLEASCEATRSLYLFMLSLVPALTAEAQSRIDAARNKISPSAEDLNPNEKFVRNSLSEILSTDPDLSKLLSKRELDWQSYDIIVRHIFDSVCSKEYYRNYMASSDSSLKADCKLFTRIFEDEIVDNKEVEDLLEEKSIFWRDDLAYALTWCCRSFSEISQSRVWRLPELYNSDEVKRTKKDASLSSDRVFARSLLSAAFSGFERYYSLISESTRGWDKERVYSMDIALICLGLAEAETFPDIPGRVTINEYVEISKYYSIPGSSSFVNGVLDKLFNELNISK